MAMRGLGIWGGTRAGGGLYHRFWGVFEVFSVVGMGSLARGRTPPVPAGSPHEIPRLVVTLSALSLLQAELIERV